MAKHKKQEISDEDIDNLFNNDDSSFLAESENDEEVQQSDLVPVELSVENEHSTKHVDRPEESESESSRIRRLAKEKQQEESDKIEKNIADVKKIDDFSNVKKYISSVRKYVNDMRMNQVLTKSIVNGATKVNVDDSTQCKFHMYEPRHIMGDTIICSCKYCSCMKEFTSQQWDDWCVQYRKWM